MFECEKCKSKKLELIKEETGQKYDIYYNEMVYYPILHFKCENCGFEQIECP